VPLLAALVAAGLLSAVAVPGGSGEAHVEAGTARLDVTAGTYRLDGGVVITRGAVRLRARSARWDPRTGTVDASGEVLLTDATRAVSAEAIHAVMGGDFQATAVLAFVKEAPAALEGATTVQAAAACGRNALTASARTVDGEASGRFRLAGARLTPCDCPDGGPPSWELRSERAIVIPGERVELSWPVLWITPRFLFMDRPIPVLALPYLSLPLGNRVSGLLMPRLESDFSSRFTLAQPWFQTLGQSADLTFTPRYAFGQVAGTPSVRGPGLDLEARWAPAVDSVGRVEADGLWNLDDEPGAGAGVPGARRLRLALAGAHSQRLGEAARLRAELDLVGDPLYVRDFTRDPLSRDSASRRSAVQASLLAGDAALELSAAWLQPVSSSGALGATDYGLFGARLPAFHRWPSLAATLPPVDAGGGLRLSGRLGLARFAPPRGATSDGGADGLGPADHGWLRDAADPLELDGRWEPGERLAATRLDGRVELREVRPLGPLVAEAFLRGAALGYLFDAGRDPLANGWLAGGLELSTVLTRRYGKVRHELIPRAEWRVGSAVAGPSLPAFGYDAWDRGSATPPGAALAAPRLAAAAPPGVFSQARLSLSSHLVDEQGERFFAEVGQELDQRAGRLAEGYLEARATRGLVSGEADLRVWSGGRPSGAPVQSRRSWLDAFSLARLRLAVADGRGDSLGGSLLSVDAGGSGRLGEGVDSLFDPRAAALPAQAWATGDATVRLGPAALSYQAVIAARAQTLGGCQGGTREVAAWAIRQHTGALEWDSPCHCFRLRASLRIDDCGALGYGLTVDLGRAGAPQGR